MVPTRFRSLRQRFLVIVLLGAILPLAATGSWLTRSAVRSAEGLLRSQLDTSLATIAADMERRWEYRRGDLLLLAGNEVVVRTMASRTPRVTAADSGYMARLYSDLVPTIPRAQFRAADGTVRWTFADSDTARTCGVGCITGPTRRAEPHIPVTLPILTESGERLGELDADVGLTAVLPNDSIRILVKGAQLTVRDHATGRPFSFEGLGDAPRDSSTYTVAGATWIAVHRVLSNAPLEITAAAPTREYVAPFEHEARLGLLLLVVVTLVALMLSMYFTARVTRSLERLVVAADAVAAGDLERDVEASGHDEVARLARSFNTMLESLRRTLRELAHREALAAVGEFAASLSHEVRNGLTAVRVDLQRVEESALPDSIAAKLVTRALRNVQRLNSTVTGALAVARSGRAALEPVDLGTVLDASAAAAESAFAGSGSTLSIDHGHVGPCSVRADSAALEQLFLNLFLNAGQAMSRGGRATVELSADETTCTVTIRDSGNGMPADRLAQSGQPFYSSKRGGTGLGLSIAKKIAEAHGGDLMMESRSRDGTVVRVRLPRDRHHR